MDTKLENPSGATHYLCDAAPYPRDMTHDMLPTKHSEPVQRCRWCRRTDAEVRQEVGL